MHEQSCNGHKVIDLNAIRVRTLLADLRATDPDLDTRRVLDVALRTWARDKRYARFAPALYATARTLRAPCRNASRGD